MRPRVSALLAYAAAIGLAAAPVRLAAQVLPDVIWSVPVPSNAKTLAVSPDGSTIALGMWNDDIRLLRASDGSHIRDLRYSSNDHYMNQVVFSPDSSLLLSCMANNSVGNESARLWRVADGAMVRALIGASPFTNCGAFSPDGERVACGRDEEYDPLAGYVVDKRTLQVWRPSTGTRFHDIEWDIGVKSIAYSPTGAHVATGTSRLIRIWNAADFTEVVTWEAHDYTVGWLAYTPDGTTLVSAQAMRVSDDRPKIKLWNTADWSLRHELTGPKRRILSVAVAPDGSTVACSSGDTPEQYGLTIWRVSDGAELASYTGFPYQLRTLTYTPDSAFILCGWADETVVMARNPFAPLTASSLTVPDVSGQLGGTVSLAARLANSGAPVVGREVAFAVEGAVAGSGVTDSAGWARLDYVVPDAGGTGMRSIQAEFAGDASFGPATGSGTLHALRTDTRLYALDRTGAIGTTCYLKGYLSRWTDRARLPGRTLAFSVEGTVVGTTPTVGQGPAVLPYVIEDGSGAGDRAIAVEWAGDGLYGPSVGFSTLTALRGRLSIWVLQPRTAPVGGSVYLRSYVRSLPNYAWKAGLPIVFSVDGTHVGTETTNAAGRAFLLYVVPPDAAVGDHPFTCSFAGDAAYEPTEQGGLLTVTP